MKNGSAEKRLNPLFRKTRLFLFDVPLGCSIDGGGSPIWGSGIDGIVPVGNGPRSGGMVPVGFHEIPWAEPIEDVPTTRISAASSNRIPPLYTTLRAAPLAGLVVAGPSRREQIRH